MKKFISLLLAAAVSSAALCCASCGSAAAPAAPPSSAEQPLGPQEPEGETPPAQEHEHTYATTWTYDGEYHWHAATCEHTTEIKDKAEHNIAAGSCSVCGYTPAPAISADVKDMGELRQSYRNNLETFIKAQTAYVYQIATEENYDTDKIKSVRWDIGSDNLASLDKTTVEFTVYGEGSTGSEVYYRATINYTSPVNLNDIANLNTNKLTEAITKGDVVIDAQISYNAVTQKKNPNLVNALLSKAGITAGEDDRIMIEEYSRSGITNYYIGVVSDSGYSQYHVKTNYASTMAEKLENIESGIVVGQPIVMQNSANLLTEKAYNKDEYEDNHDNNSENNNNNEHEGEGEIQPHEHEYGEYVLTIEPTRTTKGKRAKTCKICGDKQYCDVDSIDYDYTEGLYYELNKSKTGYIVKGCCGIDPVKNEFTAVNKSTTIIAPHAVYNGLPVVEIWFIGGNSTSVWVHGGIEYYGFDISDQVTKIIIPETVEKYSPYVYPHAYTNLQSIEVVNTNPVFSSENGILYNKSKTKLISYPINKSSNTYYTIGNNITEIGDSAFSGTKFNKIILGDNVRIVGSSVFRYCLNLSDIIIDDKIERCGGVNPAVSSDNPNLTFTRKNNVKYLGNSKNPYLLMCGPTAWNVKITIDPNTKVMADGCLYNLEKHTILDIPNSVQYIGEGVLSQVSADTINIGSGVRKIYGYIDRTSTRKTQKEYNVSINNAYYSSVDGVLYNKSQTELISYPTNKDDISYTILKTCTKIDDYAFASCSILENVSIPNGVIEIGKYAWSIYSTALSERNRQNWKIRDCSLRT